MATDVPRLYINRQPDDLAREQAAARQVGVAPVEIPSEDFETLAAAGVRMIFVVLSDSRLVVAPRRQHNENISHAVLSDGNPVLAAGEFDVEFREAEIIVSAINNMSGHYQPAANVLEMAREAFDAAGISVRPDAVNPYDWEAT